jgi:WD40 repeat protein
MKFPPLVGHSDWVFGVCFTRDDKLLLSSDYNGLIRCWNVETGVAIGQCSRKVHCTLLFSFLFTKTKDKQPDKPRSVFVPKRFSFT